jgi:hypothetical protein
LALQIGLGSSCAKQIAAEKAIRSVVFIGFIVL